ncbi:MAG: class I SAM-dependent methyltransferase [Candidatus Binatia bacterium]
MDIHPLFGPVVLERNWVPAPSYLLRRDRIFQLLAGSQPGRLLEIGCGAGALLFELASRGFDCEAYETSPEALALARYVNERVAGARPTLYSTKQPHWPARFDYLCAFEVLEHIDDHAAALREWRSWLTPGGRLLLSVPAHQHRWGIDDVCAGHLRRYERSNLVALLGGAGFAVEQLDCYGFPLANLIRPLRGLKFRRRMRAAAASGSAVDSAHRYGRDHAADTEQSGIDRATESRLFGIYRGVPGRLALRTAFALQHLFVSTELGTGYLVSARAS